MTRHRIRRLAIGISFAAIASLGLTGCASNQPGTFTRTVAQADVTDWTRQVADAAGPPTPTSQVTLHVFDPCQTDHSFINLTTQWRTVTSLGVPLARQATAINDIQAALTADGWKAKHTHGAVIFSGPTHAKHHGMIIVEGDGASQLSVTVISPCY